MAGAKRRGPYIKDQRVAIAGGVVGLVVAAFCFRDAYERRNKGRPVAVSWLGV